MFKNNLLSICIHLGLCFGLFCFDFVLSIILLLFSFNYPHSVDSFSLLMDIIRIIVAVGLYFFAGFSLLKSQGSKTKNLLSVSLIAILQLVLWIGFYIGGIYEQSVTFFTMIVIPFHGWERMPFLVSLLPTLIFWLIIELKPILGKKHT